MIISEIRNEFNARKMWLKRIRLMELVSSFNENINENKHYSLNRKKKR